MTEIQQKKSQIELYNTQFTQLPYEYQKYIIARVDQPKYNQITENQKKALCLEVIARGYVQFRSAGQDDDNELVIQTQMLKEVLNGTLGSLTTEEVKRAFYLGLTEEKYGEIQSGMCQKTYYKILNGYFIDKKRMEAAAAWDIATQSEKTTSPEQKLQKSKLAIQNQFNDYKNSGNIGNIPHVIYDTICEIKGVKTLITDKVRDKIIEITTQDEQSEKQDVDKLKKMHSAIAKIMVNTQPKKYNKTPLINRQKTLALKHYFDTLIETKTNIEF